MFKVLPRQMGPLDVLVLLDTRLTVRQRLSKNGLIELLSTPRVLASMLPRYKRLIDNFSRLLMMSALGSGRCAHAMTQQATAH